MVRGQDMQGEGMPTHGDFNIIGDPVEILNAGRKDGLGLVGIGDLRAASTW